MNDARGASDSGGSTERPRPSPNRIERPFWEAAREGRFAIQRCGDCGDYCYPPRVACPVCSGGLDWEEVPGRGEIYTYGIVHRPSDPDYFDAYTPYVVAVVELDEGPRVLASLVGVDPGEVEIGNRVCVTFEDAGDGFALPVFEPA